MGTPESMESFIEEITLNINGKISLGERKGDSKEEFEADKRREIDFIKTAVITEAGQNVGNENWINSMEKINREAVVS